MRRMYEERKKSLQSEGSFLVFEVDVCDMNGKLLRVYDAYCKSFFFVLSVFTYNVLKWSVYLQVHTLVCFVPLSPIAYCLFS